MNKSLLESIVELYVLSDDLTQAIGTMAAANSGVDQADFDLESAEALIYVTVEQPALGSNAERRKAEVISRTAHERRARRTAMDAKIQAESKHAIALRRYQTHLAFCQLLAKAVDQDDIPAAIMRSVMGKGE